MLNVCHAWVVLATMAPGMVAQPADVPVTPLGSYANIKSDGEHAYGYSVDLWSHGTEVVGLVGYHEGLAGDAPAGMLTDVRFNRSTGDIAFSAKLTIGAHTCAVHSNLPSHDLLSFRGQLRGRSLRGTFTLEDHLHTPPIVGSRAAVTLHDDRSRSPYLRGYATLDAWRADYRKKLERLGPKW